MPEDKEKAVVKKEESETGKLPMRADELSESEAEKVVGGAQKFRINTKGVK